MYSADHSEARLGSSAQLVRNSIVGSLSSLVESRRDELTIIRKEIRASTPTAYIATTCQGFPRGSNAPVLRPFWTMHAKATPLLSSASTAWAAMLLRS